MTVSGAPGSGSGERTAGMRRMPARRDTRILAAAALVLALGRTHALADYGDALDTKGGGICARYVLHARHALEQGHVSEAVDYSNRALALQPAYIYALFTKGRAELAGGESSSAIADFDRVIAAYPEYPMVYAYRAEAHLIGHDPARAIQDDTNALSAPVGSRFYLASTIFAVRSVAYELAGQPEASIADLKQAMSTVAITDHDWSMLNVRCYVAAVIGLLDTAAEACDDSIARRTRDMDVYDSRGLVDLKQRAWDRAIADYTRSLYYRPDLSYSLYGRGLARRARGDRTGSATDIAAALSAEPHIAEIMARLGVVAPP